MLALTHRLVDALLSTSSIRIFSKKNNPFGSFFHGGVDGSSTGLFGVLQGFSRGLKITILRQMGRGIFMNIRQNETVIKSES